MRRSCVLAVFALGVSFAGGVFGPAVAGEAITYAYDPLGRLVAAKSDGTVNDGQAHALCFDSAGNRTKYYSSNAGMVPGCAPTPSSMPSPVAPSAPDNTPPTAVADSGVVPRGQTKVINVIANDTDADGDFPLVLTAVSLSSGSCTITMVSETQISVTRGGGTFDYSPCISNYTVTDARGAGSVGQLTATR